MPRKRKGYSRVDSDDNNAHGWLVRIRREGVRHSRFISDSTHGGKRKSEKVAKEVYENWLKEMPPADSALNKIGKRNSSGIVGVHHSWDQDARYTQCHYESYVASWVDEGGTRRNMRFSVNQVGKKKALEMACIAREHRLLDRDAILKLYEQGAGKAAAKKFNKKATAGTPTTKHAAAKKKAPKKKAAAKTSLKKSTVKTPTAKKKSSLKKTTVAKKKVAKKKSVKKKARR